MKKANMDSIPFITDMMLGNSNHIKRKEDSKLLTDTLQKIKAFEVSKKTPLEALNQICEWQNSLELLP